MGRRRGRRRRRRGGWGPGAPGALGRPGWGRGQRGPGAVGPGDTVDAGTVNGRLAAAVEDDPLSLFVIAVGVHVEEVVATAGDAQPGRTRNLDVHQAGVVERTYLGHVAGIPGGTLVRDAS